MGYYNYASAPILQPKSRQDACYTFDLTIPLVLYMIGRYTELYTLFSGIVWRWDDFPNAYLGRSIFRAGVISGSILFGVAFLVVARKIEAGKIRDYFTIAAIGAM